MNIPKNKLPRFINAGIYNPEIITKETNLNNFIKEVEVQNQAQQVQIEVSNKILNTHTSSNGVPIPLTEEESIIAGQHIAFAQKRVSDTQSRLESIRNMLSDRISDQENGKELSFTLDLKKKGRVRRALKKLYGQKIDTITFSMYTEMLKAKRRLEKEEVKDYARGITKDKENE